MSRGSNVIKMKPVEKTAPLALNVPKDLKVKLDTLMGDVKDFGGELLIDGEASKWLSKFVEKGVAELKKLKEAA